MSPRILNAVAWSVAAMALGAAPLGCRATDAPSSSAPAATTSEATTPAATTPAAAAPTAAPKYKSQSRPKGLGGMTCTDDEWVDPSPGRNGKDQIVTIDIYPPDLPKIRSFNPECAKESEDGDMIWKAPNLPAGYTLELQIEFWQDPKTMKHYKGPFKRSGPKNRYPVPGTCLMFDAKDECLFDRHDDVGNDVTFAYTVYLWDTQDQLADVQDPGIMVIDNP